MTPQCEAILGDFAASHWLKQALATALGRDPVDALADAEALANALRGHFEAVQRAAAEAVGLDLEQLKAKSWRDSDEMG